MTRDLERLEEVVTGMKATLGALERRVRALENSMSPEEVPARPGGEAAPGKEDRKSGVRLGTTLLLVGRSLLILGGAFFLRALTDSGVLSPGLGVAMGVAYALLWLVFSDRSGARGDAPGAAAHGLTAAIIGYPLLIETITRFDLLSAAWGAGALGLFLAVGVFVAEFRRIRLVAWPFVAGAMATAWALLFVENALIPSAGVLLTIGFVTVWLGHILGWKSMRWIAAFQADVLILVVGLLVLIPEHDGAESIQVPVATFRLLAGILVAVYLGSFVLWTVFRRRNVGGFEVVQSLFVVAVGYGGLVVTRGDGSMGAVLSIVALGSAAICYTVAFSFGDRNAASRINFYLYGWLALLFILLGSAAIAGGIYLTFALCGLALVATALGCHFGRSTLQYQAAVYVTTAALQSGFATDLLRIWFGPAAGTWPAVGLEYTIVLVTAFACHAWMVSVQRSLALRWVQLTPRAVTGALWISGAGGLLVVALAYAFSAVPPGADPAILAVLRSVILAMSAAGLALVGHRAELREFAWLVFPVLVLGGAKLLFEDFRHGHPATLFVGLACYGMALILVSRVIRLRGAPSTT